jgi:hypothetical protein
MHLSTNVRVGLLIGLLLIEIAAVASLKEWGWLRTGSAIRWLACLAAAVLPLAVAAILLFGRRLRFSTRGLLAAMAVVAVFLVITGIPMRDAISQRRVTSRLISLGADLHGEPLLADYYAKLGYSQVGTAPINKRFLPWVRPLLGERLSVLAHDEVLQIDFSSDQQIAEFVRQPSLFSNLRSVSVIPRVTPRGMELLRQAAQQPPSLSRVYVDDVAIPPGWLGAFPNVETVFLSVTTLPPRFGGAGGGLRLVDEHLADLAALPKLKVLTIRGHDLTQTKIGVLGQSTALEQIHFARTGLIVPDLQELKKALPKCTIRRN